MSDVSRMLECHAEGLQRVAAVINGNPDYDDLMEHKLTSADRERFGINVDIAEKRLRAASLVADMLRSYKYKMMLPEFSGFVCDGNTRNNLREFEFFYEIFSSLGEDILEKNYSRLPRISAGKLTAEKFSYLDKIVSDLQEFYRESNTITASLVRQHILYSRSFFSFLLSFSAAGSIKPVALLLANDHSPVRVALSMIFKGLAIPRIYLQHAEVTQSFPRLDFEYSVLRNRRSVDIYRQIGPLSGRIYVIPRYEKPFDVEKLSRVRTTPTTVVIYPTARILVGPLRTLIEVLARNASVRKIIIKEHPGAADGVRHLASVADVEFSATVPEEDHVAIVGNSSVAVELLHQGIPVYQNFDFDPVKRDYYGFVRSGITSEISIADAAQAFWKPYDPGKQWLEAYSAWDASADEEYLQDHKRFVEDMSKLKPLPDVTARRRRPMKGWRRARVKGSLRRNLIKFVNAHPRLSSAAASRLLVSGRRISDLISINTDRIGRFLSVNTKVHIDAPVWRHSGNGGLQVHAPRNEPELLRFLLRTLAQVEDPATWLLRNEQVDALPVSELIAALESAFQERDAALNKVFEGISGGTNGSAVVCWAYLKKVEWGNLPLAPAEIDAISVTVYGYDGDPWVGKLLEQALLAAILRSGTCEQLDRMWQNASFVKRSGLALSTKLQVLRKLQLASDRRGEAERLLQEIEEQASRFEILKLENMEFLQGRGSAGWDHAEAEQQFLKVAPADLRREFSQKVKPAFDAMRPQMHFMNVRSDKAEADRLLALVRNALETKRPFSLIRLSDGEGYLFPEGTIFSCDDRSNRERHWWGRELPADLAERIVHQAREAVAQADVVGIPTVYRFIRDHGEGSLSLAQSVQGRGLLEVLAGTPGIVSASAAITEDKINVALFPTPDELTRLFPLAERVVVVSSVLRDALPQVFQSHGALEVILLPTHHKTALNEKYHTGSQPLPFTYEAVLEQLDKTVKPGDLVLVAGGIVGKILIGRSRARGAVALDLGHVIDDWISLNLPSVR